MFSRSALFAAGLVTTIFASLAGMAAAGSLAEIKARGKIVVGVKDTAPPFGFRNEHGELTGLEVELANDIAAQLGVGIELFPVTSTSRMQFLGLGRLDLLIATLAVTAHRQSEAHLVEPHYYASTPSLFVRRDSGVKTLADLEGAKICTLLNRYLNPLLAANAPKTELVEFRDLHQAAMALAEGRCEALAEEHVELYQLQNHKTARWDDYDLVELELAPLPWALAVQPGAANAELQTRLAGIVRDWHKAGRLLELEKKWLGYNTEWARQMHETMK
ncbi:MAG: transporter substrate-binding domain-containing protein [Rhodomicrobiaceae bacterium]